MEGWKRLKLELQKLLDADARSFALFFAIGFGISLASGYYTGFHVAGIDFWTILYYGRHMTFAEPASLFNGFYPFGYAFLVGQLPFTYILPLSYLLNALLAGLFTASVSTLVAASRSWLATSIALISSILMPMVFENANILGPDIGSLGFTAFAVFLLWRGYFRGSFGDLSDLESLGVGVSLGLAALFRSHAIVSSFAIFLGCFLLRGIRPVRPRLIMIVAFLFVSSLQAAVNLLSGHGALETAQNFNIYKTIHGVEWTVTPTPQELEDFSLVGAVKSDPAGILALYFGIFRYYVFVNWTVFALFLVSPKGGTSRYALFSIILVLVYAIPLSLSDSPRGQILLLGADISSLALLPVALQDSVNRYLPSRKWMGVLAATIFVLFLAPIAYQWIARDLELLRLNRDERKVLFIVEQVLWNRGMRSPDEVFSDRYDFYTPTTMPYRSRMIGNWSGDWIWGFADEYPSLPNDSWESFSEACKAQGIRFLALSHNSYYRGDFFLPIYNEEVELASLGLTFIGQRGKLRIYEFQ